MRREQPSPGIVAAALLAIFLLAGAVVVGCAAFHLPLIPVAAVGVLAATALPPRVLALLRRSRLEAGSPGGTLARADAVGS